MSKREQAEKTPVVCARCGWRGKRSQTTVWPACPRCRARAEMIIPQAKESSENEKETS